MADGRDPNGAADGRRRPGRSEQGLRVLEAALVDAVVPPSLLAAHPPALVATTRAGCGSARRLAANPFGRRPNRTVNPIFWNGFSELDWVFLFRFVRYRWAFTLVDQ